ncbi:hypothetical protein BC938DRAFT_475916 [Jimgerdemannia flammicorona]|uniref:protein-serine/threonine phosphatase n=1 Tax=Jimgerdemannia flammicorona TaxID=994334 RepID=A0A433PMK7_9FUNG|nr:hypothetical protein BC938DRAFT_475916 [Jimgerdemannia flammicorona]
MMASILMCLRLPTTKSAYTNIREEGSSEIWELHLKPSRDRSNIFGYICKHSDMQRIIREQQDGMLKLRRLPLVLDLDDTLVRLVGSEPGRYVPESALLFCRDRVRDLRDGRKVVLTERVHEFLDWAQKFFEISVCSLGDQNYVDMVVHVLDPTRTRIRGIYYSARQEYEYIRGSHDQRRPSKDLLALYAFCTLTEPGVGYGFSLPLIVDDLTHMWPSEQHDNIIVVKEKKGAQVWTVNLFPVVQHALQYVHSEFFRLYDIYCTTEVGGPGGGGNGNGNGNGNGTGNGNGGGASAGRREMPSAVNIYKEYLRGALRDQIAGERLLGL